MNYYQQFILLLSKQDMKSILAKKNRNWEHNSIVNSNIILIHMFLLQ